MSNGLVLLDESGDLGWVFDKPYRQGGSSRYFTIAATLGTDNGHRKCTSVVRSLRKEFNWTSSKEKKWSGLGSSVRRSFALRAANMVKENRNVQLLVALVDKQKIPRHIRDGNFHIFYSWLVSSLIAPAVRCLRSVSICPDELNAGEGYDALLECMIRKDLWFNLRSETTVNRVVRDKALEDGLSFCDYLAGAFQSHYEDQDSDAFRILKPCTYLHIPWS